MRKNELNMLYLVKLKSYFQVKLEYFARFESGKTNLKKIPGNLALFSQGAVLGLAGDFQV